MACFHHNPVSGTQICVIPNPGFRFERPSKLKPFSAKYAISLANNLVFFLVTVDDSATNNRLMQIKKEDGQENETCL